jgi:hypothetical protein
MMMPNSIEPGTFQARLYFDLSGLGLSQDEVMDMAVDLYETFDRLFTDLDLGAAISGGLKSSELEALITVDASTPAEAEKVLADIVARFDAHSPEFRGRVASARLEEPLAA